MYAPFFGLKQEPFSIAPDPRYLFMSERHREALAHLLYGIGGGGGFVLLTGEIGAGKTTVCRCFLEQIPKRCNVAVIFNPKLSATELLQAVCDEFRIPVAHRGDGVATVKDHVDALNRFLLETHAVGQNNLLIIDEAQNLSADVLEQLRLLTNLETNERKLLQIVLIGQPELRGMLARPDLEQLAQRVIARYHLKALTEAETLQYIAHRLAVAGGRAGLFDESALKRIHALARGVPRRINLLADRALLGAYAEGRRRVDRRIVDRAAAEVFGRGDADPWQASRARLVVASVAGIVAGAALFGIGLWAFDASRSASAPVAQASASAPRRAAPAHAAAAGSAVASATTSAGASANTAAPPQPAASHATAGEAASAWRGLAAVWKLGPIEGDPCVAALRDGLRCFRGGASLTLLRRLDRPVILTLRGDDAAVPAQALLTGLDDTRALLLIDGVAQTLPLARLAARWRGDFATFWRAPPGYVDAVVRDGAAADWLGRELERLPGAAPADPALPRADALRARVLAFQSAHGLPADGLAGPLTLMQLNRAAGVDEPRLTTPP